MNTNLAFITESKPLMRRALRSLAKEAQIICIGEAESGVNLLDKIVTPPDLLLLDLDMDYLKTPLDTIDQLRVSYPSVSIATLSHQTDKPLLIERLKPSNVEGYILKNDPCHQIRAAIKRVAKGYQYCSNQIVKRMIEATAKPSHRLSRRETEVFFLAKYSDEEIAERLHISLSTVKTHINRIKLKLFIKRRFELVKLAF